MSICLRCWDDASFQALMAGEPIVETYHKLVDARNNDPEQQQRCREYTERMEFIAFAGPVRGEGH